VKQTEGFYISVASTNSGHKKAGLRKDVIIKLDNQNIATYADFGY
jgi:S1-C subfamily serine protease